jgi:hypothetical protein
MQMVAHFGVEGDLDAKERGQLLLAAGDPQPSMIEVPAGERILAAEKGSANTTRPTMIDTDFPIIDDFTTGATGHVDSLSGVMV